jgi:replicative DNA helicase
MNETGSRIPPQAVDVERSVLGAMLLDKDAVPKVVELLDDSCFYNPTHTRFYKAMLRLFERSEPIDGVTVANELRASGTITHEDPVTITDLTMGVSSSANVEFHAAIVLQKANLRSLISAGSEIVTRAYNETEDVGELLDEAQSAVFRISERRMRKSFSAIKGVVFRAFAKLEKIAESKGHTVIGVSSGFQRLDDMTTGFQDSDLIIIAGRPSSGKTALAMAIAQNAALSKERPTAVAVFSLEMSEDQLAVRMISSAAKVNAHTLRSGKCNNQEWAQISRASGKLSEAKIFIDDTASLAILELRAKARRMKAEHNIGLVVVDYLQLISGPKKAESREREISEISKSLKALAKELNVPVIALSQLNRNLEARPDKVPTLADLRESGSIEQDADVVIFVHRPEMYKINTIRDEDLGEIPSEGVAQLIIGKQRNGPTGTIALAFKKDYAGFENLAPMGFEQYLPPPARDYLESDREASIF